MPGRVRITDVAPRDGLQNEAGMIATQDKVRLVELLCATGVDEVEVTSFVSPKWVPQLGDGQQVLEGVRSDYGRAHPTPRPLPREGAPILSVLVPNEAGFERALALHTPDFPLKIAVFTAASETFSKRNTNASIGETIDRFRAFLPRAFDAGMAVRMYISCAIACPFEGPVAPDAVRAVADTLLALAPSDAVGAGRVEIDLGDTIGVAEPEDINRLLARFGDLVDSRLIVLHLHDTYGRAPACVRRALDLGVRSFDGSVAGLGGCPYAGTKERRAPGNISTETLVRTIDAAGYRTGVDPARLAEAAAFAQRIVAAAREAEATR